MQYYRVETYDMAEEKTIGGFMSAIDYIITSRLGISPDSSPEERAAAYDKTEDTVVRNLIICEALLCDMPIPEVYENDRDNNYCLYKEEEFVEETEEFLKIAEALEEETDYRLTLIAKTVEVPEEKLLYEDIYQVVVSKETYESSEQAFIEFDDMFEDEDFDDFE